MTVVDPAQDELEGVAAIAAYIGRNTRRTYYLLEIAALPAYKLGGKWCMRKSTYAAHIEALERAARADRAA